MKTVSMIILTILFILAGQAMNGQGEGLAADRTESPYFFIPTDDPGSEKLPLKSTSACVNIAGIIADVTVTQEYKNDGRKPIEAVYVFPASTRAAVYSMVMTIGERVIVARIEEKDRARQQYEEARNNGQSASLLEQERPNVFTMNVANIMPGDLIRVELKYTELLVPEEKVYRFVYPTVVGPRYSGDTENIASLGDGWNANPYTLEGVKPFYDFNIEVGISAGMPIKDLRCVSHRTTVAYTGKSHAQIRLDPGENSGGNRDFILEYRLSGQEVETGLLLFEGGKENFFLAMIQPPARLAPENIPPREYVFIVDVSGSMHGFPIETSKKLLSDLIGGLRTSDRFNVLLFAGGSSLFSEQSVMASRDNIQSALSFIGKEQGGGGTELLPALRRALSLKGTEGFSRTFIIATDGYVTVEREAFELVRESLGEANFFAFGIGSSVNRYLVEGLAHAGQGEPFIVDGEKEAQSAADGFRRYVSSPVLTNIRIAFDGIQAYDLAQETWPDVFADRPVLVYGKYRGKHAGSLSISGTTGSGSYFKRVDLAMASPEKDLSGLVYLWARERIRTLDDFSLAGYESDEIRKEVTGLGLEYNLLTRYTSFIAIDSESRNTSGELTAVRQPLPLPEGVSNYAVGGVMQKAAPGQGKRAGAAREMCELVEYDIEKPPALVETKPVFTGGEEALVRFIEKNLVYPEESRKNGISGVVIVEFIVETDGSIKQVRILRSLDRFTDQEVIRVVKLMSGMWKPGEMEWKNTAMRVVLSNFKF